MSEVLRSKSGTLGILSAQEEERKESEIDNLADDNDEGETKPQLRKRKTIEDVEIEAVEW